MISGDGPAMQSVHLYIHYPCKGSPAHAPLAKRNGKESQQAFTIFLNGVYHRKSIRLHTRATDPSLERPKHMEKNKESQQAFTIIDNGPCQRETVLLRARGSRDRPKYRTSKVNGRVTASRYYYSTWSVKAS